MPLVCFISADLDCLPHEKGIACLDDACVVVRRRQQLWLCFVAAAAAASHNAAQAVPAGSEALQGEGALGNRREQPNRKGLLRA